MEETIKLPTLYSKSKAGKVLIWNISVNPVINASKIITVHGQEDGKQTEAIKNITEGKNIGRANATTHYTQAISEAKSKWTKKKDQGYSESLIDSPPSKTDVILPMLAHDYNKRGKDIKFPCFVQPKLDGVRAIFRNGVFQSRTGKIFPPLDHISKELTGDIVLDGELYSKELGFQDIVGIVKKEKMNKNDLIKIKKIIYIVYDTIPESDIRSTLGYDDRNKILEAYFKDKKLKYSELNLTEICKKKEDLVKFHDKYVKKGYEGLIIRNFEGPYEIKNRSKNLQKYKIFLDSEFKIVGYTSGTGIEEGSVIWICVTDEGKKFSVRPQGTHKQRQQLYRDAEKYIGSMLTVKFFEYTDDKVPRFPVGISIRNYE